MPTRYDPFHEVDRWLTNAMRAPAPTAMPMDLYRQGDVFLARIDMPGVDPSTVDIDVEDRTLTIRAERTNDVGGDAAVQWLSRERPTGTFARQLTLGYGVSMDKIAADYRDGVLTLTIPVAEEAKPRKVTVSHSAAPSSAVLSTASEG
ncbi:MAG: Hsp20/alpha crystallin family protein [Austwickia sp.]|jgi:HSP20 family protein|nr:Hsp20/alpha crystallin family protein [Austwickia sp.]MBK8437291.1 Hsp20/alpha crystallin family protein [Austwickia sp.]MBK9102533.1 Hsp20/alpha crystallin family protein [Austwickia sp.]